METPVILVIVGVVLLIGGIWALARHLEKKRTAALRAEADGMGLEFYANGGDISPPGLSQFDLFSRGHTQRVKNAMVGPLGGAEVAVFDYKYVTGHGKHRTTHNQTVVMFDMAGADLPNFILKPENIFHKIGGVFGYQDIDFDDHPKFSKQYLLRGGDEEAIRAAFGEEVLDHFDLYKGLCVEAGGQRLLVYRGSRPVKPAAIRGFVDDARDVLDLFCEQAQGIGERT